MGFMRSGLPRVTRMLAGARILSTLGPFGVDLTPVFVPSGMSFSFYGETKQKRLKMTQ